MHGEVAMFTLYFCNSHANHSIFKKIENLVIFAKIIRALSFKKTTDMSMEGDIVSAIHRLPP